MRGAGGRPEVEGTVVRLVLVDLCLFIPRKTLVRACFEEALCSVYRAQRTLSALTHLVSNDTWKAFCDLLLADPVGVPGAAVQESIGVSS